MSDNSRVPEMIDALVEAATGELTDRDVFDGFGVSDDPGNVLMIGVDDLDAPNYANSGESLQNPATLGQARSRDEAGTITCCAMSWNGDNDMKAARDSAFATVDAIGTLCRTTGTPAFGVAGVRVAEVINARLLQNQNDVGAVAVVVFQVAYKARL